MAISSTSSNSYAAFSGKSAAKSSPKAQPQFGGEIFPKTAAVGSFASLDSLARIFTGKHEIVDPNDANKKILEPLYSTKEKWGIGSLISLFTGIVPTASFFTIKGFSTGVGKLWNKIFKKAPSFEHAKTQRY